MGKEWAKDTAHFKLKHGVAQTKHDYHYDTSAESRYYQNSFLILFK
jgi:hypothetical protein